MHGPIFFFEFDLFLISPAGSRGVCVSPDRSLNSSRIHASGHVVSRQTRGTGAGSKVCSSIHEGFNCRRILLFDSPHQSGCVSEIFFSVEVCAGGNQNFDCFRITIAGRQH